MAKGYSARGGFTGGAGMMRQQQQMQQKIMKKHCRKYAADKQQQYC